MCRDVPVYVVKPASSPRTRISNLPSAGLSSTVMVPLAVLIADASDSMRVQTRRHRGEQLICNRHHVVECTPDVGTIRSLGDRLLTRLEDQRGLLEQKLVLLLGGRVLDDLRQRVKLPDENRGHPATGLADLLERSLDQPPVADVRRDHAHKPVTVAVDPKRPPS